MAKIKRDTNLDYAEFRLSQSGTRCELYISANGIHEKVASGYVKPFVSHLKAVEWQVSRGNQFVRLQLQPSVLKRIDKTWFTKGTLESFVRFVSTPDVLERVKSIEDELSQLEQVRSALAKTFSQSSEQYCSIDTTFFPRGSYEERDGVSLMTNRYSMDAIDTGGEASKRELLRAMDVRLVALRQELSAAFARAAAAGFDHTSMADLVVFSQYFGAERLGNACMQFIVSASKRRLACERDDELDAPFDEAVSSGSDMSLGSGNDTGAEGPGVSMQEDSVFNPSDTVKGWDQSTRPQQGLTSSEYDTVSRARTGMDARKRWGPPERLQIKYSELEPQSSPDLSNSGEATEIEIGISDYCSDDDISKDEMKPLQEGKRTIFKEQNQADSKSEPAAKGNMFFARLQQMAHQVEARRSAEKLDGSMRFISVGMNDESTPVALAAGVGSLSVLSEPLLSPNWDDNISSVQGSADDGTAHPNKLKMAAQRSNSMHRSFSIKPFTDSSHPTTVDANQSILKERSNFSRDTLEKSTQSDCTNMEVGKAKDADEEPKQSTSARRLSVQAAISLFESKTSSPSEPSLKKLVKQESYKGTTENNSCSTGKAFRWWSVTGLSGPGVDSEKETTLSPRDQGAAEDVDQCQLAKKGKGIITKPVMLSDTPQRHSLRQKQGSRQETNSDRNLQAVDSPKPKSAVGDSVSSFRGLQKQSVLEPGSSVARETKPDLLKSEADLAKTAISSTKTAMIQSKDFLAELQGGGSPVLTSLSTGKVGQENLNKRGQIRYMPDIVAFNGPLEESHVICKGHTTHHSALAYTNFDSDFEESSRVKDQKTLDDSSHKTGSTRFAGLPKQKFESERDGLAWELPVDLHMQALISMADSHYENLREESSLVEQRGRFYNHYCKLRDVRLKSEHPARKAEREAKLKSMKETFERRNAELNASALKLSKKSSMLAASLQQRGFVCNHSSPPAATPSDSSSCSPVSQSRYNSEGEHIYNHKQFRGPQKPPSIVTLTTKDSAKGFKRLLHFGRKSRTSEITSTDCVSVSTTSEGDDDGEDLSTKVSNDFLTRIRLSERGFGTGSTEHYSFQDQGSAKSVRTSIPAPPANFKLREDHLAGSTLIKAPLSFFSLSSFRSKGTEAKSG